MAAFSLFVAAHAQSEPCGFDARHRQLMANNSAYAAKTHDFDAKSDRPRNFRTLTPPAQGNIIPVVVHIMHKGEPVGTGTNVSDDQVHATIKRLNEAFRKVPGSAGSGDGVDVGIEFALAVRDPNGQCTNGIVRTSMTNNAEYMANGVEYYGDTGISESDLKSAGYWDSNQYYNIWVVSEFSNGTSPYVGFAYFASQQGTLLDGTVLLASSFINPQDITLVHELGHAFNLYHSFEGDADGFGCPAPNGCGYGSGDCCADTPPHRRWTGCDPNFGNVCQPGSTDMSYNHNYMTYALGSGCQNMFTQNQKERMQAALSQQRASLLGQNGNMSLVPPAAPDASFVISANAICAGGGPVKLTDTSACVPKTFLDDTQWGNISFLWTVSNGNNTYTYTSQNAFFEPAAPGFYNVTLQVTTPAGTDTHYIPGAIAVAAGSPQQVCQPTTAYQGNYGLTISNVTFNTISNNTSATYSSSYQNFTCSHITQVASGGSYGLSVTANATNNYFGEFLVMIDYNNDGIFSYENETVLNGYSEYNIDAAYTTTVTIPQTAVLNTVLTMRVLYDSGYISQGTIDCAEPGFILEAEDYGIFITQQLGLEVPQKITFSISPNPAESLVTVTSSVPVEGIALYNLIGQKVLSQSLNAATGTLDISSLPAGTYIIKASAGTEILESKLLKM